MRVTTSSIFQGINRATSQELSRLQEIQEKSTVKILSASDDPSGYKLMNQLSRDINAFSRYGTNMDQALSYSTDMDSQLDTVETALNRVDTLIAQAANGTWNQEDMDSMAEEMDSLLREVLGVANSQNSFGDYAFSGSNTDVEPYVLETDADGNIASVIYSGNDNTKKISISDSEQVSVTQNGDSVFGEDDSGVFNMLIEISDRLRSGDFSSEDGTDYLLQLKDVRSGVSTARSANGIDQNRIESLQSFNESRTANFEELLSKTRDADFTDVATQLAQHQTALQMATQLGSVLSKMAFVDIS